MLMLALAQNALSVSRNSDMGDLGDELSSCLLLSSPWPLCLSPHPPTPLSSVSSLMSESAGIPLLHRNGRHGEPLPSPFALGGLGVGQPPVRRWRLHWRHGGAPGHLPVHQQQHPQLPWCPRIPVLQQWLWKFHCSRWTHIKTELKWSLEVIDTTATTTIAWQFSKCAREHTVIFLTLLLLSRGPSV